MEKIENKSRKCKSRLNYKVIIDEGTSQFLQKIEETQKIHEIIGEEFKDYVENQNTGGEFVVYDKNKNELGKIYLHAGRFFLINKDNNDGEEIFGDFKSFDELNKWKEEYNVYYKSKDKPNELQPVYIEDDNNIQTDEGVVLSFDKIDSNNPNNGLYLKGIYDGKFKEVTKEITNPETNEKTTKTRKLLTGIANFIDENGKIYCKGELKCGALNGFCTYYDSDKNIRSNGNYKDGKPDGFFCLYNNNLIGYVCQFTDGKKNGNTIYYYRITIQHGEFKGGYLYSGSAYLREDPTGKTPEELNNEKINPDKKIYTLKINEENTNKRVITYYGKALGLDENIELQININENDIATFSIMQNGKAITNKEEIENIINKIKEFFINIPIEQLKSFDHNLSYIYYCIMYNEINNNIKEQKDITILIPDICKYHFKTDKEVEQTINLIKNIPQENRKGKYVAHSAWLRGEHRVNLIIDFDNKIFEIVNTGGYVEQEVINNLQQELRNNFKEENWIVYENYTVIQSTGNCVITSNIVATEKVMLEKQVKEYNERINKLKKVEEKINNLQQTNILEEQQLEKQNLKEQLQQQLNLTINNDENKQTLTVKELEQQVQSFLHTYNDKIETIVINEILYNDLRNEVNELKKERQGQINEQELLKEVLKRQSIKDRIENIKEDKERLQLKKDNFATYNLILNTKLFNECGNQFDDQLSKYIIKNGYAIRCANINY